MIVLDTHVWVWWVHGDVHLPKMHRMYSRHTKRRIRCEHYLLLGSGQ
jgi:PIN domain nuclease of toxin-antitoxin system